MKPLHLLTPVLSAAMLATGFPVQASAQTVKPADLKGAWAPQGETKVRFNFLTDSTMMFFISVGSGNQIIEGTAKARWRLAGDTLLIEQAKVTVQGQVMEGGYSMDPRLVTLKDGLLTLKRVAFTLPNGTKDTSAASTASAVRVYHRVEENTPPVPIQPATKP